MRNGFLALTLILALVGTTFFTTPAFAAEDPGMAALKAMNIKLDDLGKSVTPNTAQAQIRADRVVLKNHDSKINQLIGMLFLLMGDKGPIAKARETANEALTAANRANQATENIGWLWFFAPLGFLMGLIAIAMNVFKARPQQRPAANNNEEPAPDAEPPAGEDPPAEDSPVNPAGGPRTI